MTDEKRRKDTSLNLRLNQDDKAHIERNAKRKGLTMTEYVMQLVARDDAGELMHRGLQETLLECVRKTLEDENKTK
jgi:uncharacterized protein (DUF1778 family)